LGCHYPPIKAYRNPGCGCCEKWAAQLKQAGFDITMEDDPNLEARRLAAGVPAAIAACHTAFMGDTNKLPSSSKNGDRGSRSNNSKTASSNCDR
jgi:hypothetical protein